VSENGPGACRLCGQAGAHPLGPVSPTYPAAFHVETFQLQSCASCETVYLDPLPTPEDLREIYDGGSIQLDGPLYTDSERVRAVLEYMETATRLNDLVPQPGDRVLEIGAGLAWLSRFCKSTSEDVVTVAQDVSTEAADSCPWADVYFVGPLEALPDRGPFALASMTHVIERLIDPEKMLGNIAERLSPGGHIFVTAPYRPPGWDPEQGLEPWLEWSYLHVPAHISYLSRTWFEQMGPRHGLRVQHWDAGHEDGQAFELVLAKALS
jgi:SAM-dependent methyltransferase